MKFNRGDPEHEEGGTSRGEEISTRQMGVGRRRKWRGGWMGMEYRGSGMGKVFGAAGESFLRLNQKSNEPHQILSFELRYGPVCDPLVLIFRLHDREDGPLQDPAHGVLRHQWQ